MVIGVLILQHTEVDADRSWYEICVGVSSRASIYRACIHTSAASHALECLPVVFVGEDIASAVLHENDVEFSSWPWFAEVGCKDCGGLSCAVACEKSLEYSHSVIVGYDFFESYAGYMQFWH